MLSKVNLDELSRESREFYERAFLKFSGSLFFAALALMFLGFSAQTGGQAAYYAKVSSTLPSSVSK